MAMTSRRPGLLWSRLHFGLRVLGLTGAAVAAVGLGLIQPTQAKLRPLLDALGADETRQRLGGYLFFGGAAVAVAGLLVELLSGVRGVAGRRSAFRLNAAVQVVLAAVLVAAVNVLSAGYQDWRGLNARIDTTRDGAFTLPAELKRQFEELDPEAKTSVIVYLRHKTFSGIDDRADRYDFAAEKKVVEKVRDLVGLLREAGPRFDVTVLDVEEERFDERLTRLTAGAPALRKAIEGATENTVFVAARDPADATRTLSRQMSFNELYQLDRVASKADGDGRGNLVLLGQGQGRGVEPFARRILGVQQRRPRVGLLVIHAALATESKRQAFTSSGLKKSLEANGYDVTDVVVKAWEKGVQPAADTYEQSKLVRIEADLEAAVESLKELDAAIAAQTEDAKSLGRLVGEAWESKARVMLRRYAGIVALGDLSREENKKAVLNVLARKLSENREDRDARARERAKLDEEMAALDVDSIRLARRMTDVKAKLGQALAECDVLMVPRMTRDSATGFPPTDAEDFDLSKEQAEVVKAFLAKGKPVLACLGPINSSPTGERKPAPRDDLESILTDLGFVLSNHTVLFDSDAKAFVEERRSALQAEPRLDTPKIDLDGPTAAAYGRAQDDPRATHPLRRSLRVTARSLDKGFDLSMRFPRPVYFVTTAERRSLALAGGHLLLSGDVLSALTAAAVASEPRTPSGEGTDPTFLVTATGWNDPQPFLTRLRRPRYEEPRPDDPTNGTFDVRRRGAFPVGTAAEVELPADWGAAKGRTARVAVIGHADVFTGTELNPARERLLLQTATWLLGRDEELPRDEHAWRYPRSSVSQDGWEYAGWVLAMALGLPGACAYLGVVVLLYRRLR